MADNNAYEKARKRNVQKTAEEKALAKDAETFERALKTIDDERLRNVAKHTESFEEFERILRRYGLINIKLLWDIRPADKDLSFLEELRKKEEGEVASEDKVSRETPRVDEEMRFIRENIQRDRQKPSTPQQPNKLNEQAEQNVLKGGQAKESQVSEGLVGRVKNYVRRFFRPKKAGLKEEKKLLLGAQNAASSSTRALGSTINTGVNSLGGIGSKIGKGIGGSLSRLGQAGAKLAARNPYVWAVIVTLIIIIIIILLLIMMWINICNGFIEGAVFRFLGGPCPSVSVKIPKPPEGVTLIKQGPEEVANGQSIDYTVDLTYDPGVATLPPDKLFLFDLPDYKYTIDEDKTTPGYSQETDSRGRKYIKWPLTATGYSTGSGRLDTTFTLVVTPTDQDFRAINLVFVAENYIELEITAFSGSGSGDGGGGGDSSIGDLTKGSNSAPTNRTCGGDYSVKKHLNFGDPVCSYTPAKFSAYIKDVETKPKNWEFWEDISIAEGSTRKIGGGINMLGGGGAGTFQLIPRTGELHNNGEGHGPGKWPGPAGEIGHNGRRNVPHGDLPWQKQIEQAVGWNNYTSKNGNKFMYWGTAYCLCYFDSYRNANEGWCSDIIKQKAARCPYECYPDYASGNGSCSINTDRLAKKGGNTIKCREYRCNIGVTGRDANTDKPWN